MIVTQNYPWGWFYSIDNNLYYMVSNLFKVSKKGSKFSDKSVNALFSKNEE